VRLISFTPTLCPRSLDPFYIVTLVCKMGQNFLDIQYKCIQPWKQDCINPNHIRVKYSPIVLSGGGGHFEPCLCFALPISQKIFVMCLVMIKAVLNRDFFLSKQCHKALALFSLIYALHGSITPPSPYN